MVNYVSTSAQGSDEGDEQNAVECTDLLVCAGTFALRRIRYFKEHGDGLLTTGKKIEESAENISCLSCDAAIRHT